MAKKGGIQGYTVQEAQNVSMGQAGTAYISDTNTYTPPTGSVVVAIQTLGDDAVLTTDTTTESGQYVSPSVAGPGTNGNALSTLTIPAGSTIYGRFTAVDLSSGTALLYLG
tara:strand:+ start:2360 stop:2692 length:333 start_codon:yes stop_codon:yes gene_type:complete